MQLLLILQHIHLIICTKLECTEPFIIQPGRNITYWRIDNVTENKTEWERKSFNSGFTMSNSQMIKFGIDNYLETT